jgi:hypothetical protein
MYCNLKNTKCGVMKIRRSSVSDRWYHIDPEPAPARNLYADPDPGRRSNADPEPDPRFGPPSNKVLVILSEYFDSFSYFYCRGGNYMPLCLYL